MSGISPSLVGLALFLVLVLGRSVVRILDRQRYWAFFKAYFTCYISLVGLFIVIDAFSNMDEFQKRAEGVVETATIMGRYYFIHQAAYFDLLGGVISMMAAIFTVTWMQRNNEHLAMLAAGISTHRAIRPVLISAVIVSLLSVFNQEVIIPANSEELQKSHDDDGSRKVLVPIRYDGHVLAIHGAEADRATKTIIDRFNATILKEVFGQLHEIEGKQATYIPPDRPTAPIKGGWLVRGATLNPPMDPELLEPGASIVTKVNDTTGFPPPYESAMVPGDVYFVKSGLSFKAMTRKANWYQDASMAELLDGLADPASEGTERADITMSIHVRLLRPVLAMTLMFMTLPLVLGGYGRNMFINLGFALGNSGMFYAGVMLCQYLGSNAVLAPSLAAWLPLFIFALLATIRWDWIRT